MPLAGYGHRHLGSRAIGQREGAAHPCLHPAPHHAPQDQATGYRLGQTMGAWQINL